MRVLITGGTGFIGSRLALKCIEKGDAVKVLGQVNTPAEKENRELIEGKGAELILSSVTDKDAVTRHIQGIDTVYHLAAAQHEMNIPDKVFWDVNVQGTQNMIEAGLTAGVKKFVHGSTIGVYGTALEGNVDEQSPLKPDNIYGRTKLEGEKVVLDFKTKLPVVIIRISETYGPGDRRLLKLFKTIKKKIFFIIGNGKNIHHLIYIDDLIQGLFQASINPDVNGEIFVLAGKEPVTTQEMVNIIAQEVNCGIPKLRAPLIPFLMLAAILELTMRPMGIQPPLHRRRMDFFKKSFLFSMEKSFNRLNFVPKVSFREGVHQTAEWYTQHGYL